ncbi:MAG: [FeFe] hydrogenase, group A [Bacilli bacterium]
MNKVNLTINGIQLEVPSTYTIMDAANVAGIELPRLCFLKGINEIGACRLCVVEIEGFRTLKTSCNITVAEGMVVKTNTPRVQKAIVTNLKLIAGNHRFECWKCPREDNCELLRLLRMYNIENDYQEDQTGTFEIKERIVNESKAMVIDSSKCVLCGRCVSACVYYTGLGILNYNNRGSNTFVGPALNLPIETAGCLYCGKCIQSCPVGAIKEQDGIEQAISYVNNKEYYTVACIAPSVRAAMGEEFNYKFGKNVEGQIYAALNKLGFDDITDVNYAADVTIMEEGTELIHRIKKHLAGEEVALPMFTSCCPGWIRYAETYYPELMPNLSTTKSPQQIQGALIKHYYAKKIGVDPKQVKVVSIMPCIAKKFECDRPEMENDGLRDIDCVLTTRELARWIKRNDIKFRDLADYEPASPLAKYTGAGVIFGSTGGVMEAALRTVKDIMEKGQEHQVDIKAVRGMKNIKEATMTINGIELTVAVVNGAKYIPEMVKRIKKNPGKYAFVEVMACTGGCINGGGQPIVPSYVAETIDIRQVRSKVLYTADKNSTFRKSHENSCVLEMYKEFLGEPYGELAHKLLHTTYTKRETYPIDD